MCMTGLCGFVKMGLLITRSSALCIVMYDMIKMNAVQIYATDVLYYSI